MSVEPLPPLDANLDAWRWKRGLGEPYVFRSSTLVLVWKFDIIAAQNMRRDHLEFKIDEEPPWARVPAVAEWEVIVPCADEGYRWEQLDWWLW
mgnify:CR=1 FL=1